MVKGSLLLVMAVSAATGALAALAFTSQTAPDELRPASPTRTVPVSVERFDDARDAEIVVSVAPAVAITAPGPGILSRYGCAAGQTIASGTSPFAIAGRPVLALHSSTPFWRDLPPGDATGDDVAGLQSELIRLGLPVGAPGRFDRRTAQSYATLAERAGLPEPPDDALLLSDIVWLPSPEVKVGTCDSHTGKAVGHGEPLATLRSGLEGAHLKVVPADMVAGPRHVDLGGTSVPVDEAGQVVANGLAALEGSGVYAVWIESDGAVPLGGRLVLSSPLEVLSVPPSAVVTDGTAACIFSGDDRMTVTVVASRLGQSLVSTQGPVPTEVTAYPTQDAC